MLRSFDVGSATAVPFGNLHIPARERERDTKVRGLVDRGASAGRAGGYEVDGAHAFQLARNRAVWGVAICVPRSVKCEPTTKMGRRAGSMLRLPNVVVYMCKASGHVHWMRAGAYAFEDMDMVAVRVVDQVGAGILVGARRDMCWSNSSGLRACTMQVGGGPLHPAL